MKSAFQQPTVLGRSGLTVGRIGFGSSYGAPTSAYEKAFERGCNYFYWGSMRRDDMGAAIRNLADKHRENLVVVLQSYSRYGIKVASSVESGLRKLNLDYADILLLGWHNVELKPKLMEAALREKERGRVRHLQVSGHNRPMFQQFAKDLRIGSLMVRYNATHRGAEKEVFPYLQSDRVPKPGVVTYTTTRWKTLLDPRYTPQGMKTPTATDCYRFSLTNSNVDVCLSGPASAEQMETALQALELGPLSEEEMRWMRAVGDNVHRMTTRSWNPFAQRKQ